MLIIDRRRSISDGNFNDETENKPWLLRPLACNSQHRLARIIMVGTKTVPSDMQIVRDGAQLGIGLSMDREHRRGQVGCDTKSGSCVNKPPIRI